MRLRQLLMVGLVIGATTPGWAWSLRVSDAMPVVGAEARLEVADDDAAEAHVRFSVTGPNGDWQATASAADGKASIAWTPTTPGEHSISAEVDGEAIEARQVFAVSRRLHFNHWACPPSQRYVTSVMENENEPGAAEAWLDRGVMPLRWKGGICDFDRLREAGPFADSWSDIPGAQVGIMIDEFGGGSDKDQTMGQALPLLRERSPELFQAPYCVGVSGDDMVAGFAQADLVLIETYAHDWRGYTTLERRVQSAVDAGLGDRAVAVLGLSYWASTERELRQQIAFARSRFPNMPGIGFFPQFVPEQSEAIDRAVYDYFLGPALLLRDGKVRNIGQLPAQNAGLRLADGTELVVETIAAGERTQVPEGSELLAGEGYTVVEYTPPTEGGRPSDEDEAKAAAFERETMGDNPTRPIDAAELSIERAESDNEHMDGQVSGGTIALAKAARGRMGVRYTVEVLKGHFYGTVSVELIGNTGSIGASISHGDNDRDVASNMPRVRAMVQPDPAANTGRAGATCPFALEPGRRYTIFVGYDGAAHGLATVRDEEGALLWQSDPILVVGALEVDRLRIGVRPFETSELRQTEEGVVFARGVSGGPIPSPYVLEAEITDVEVGVR